MSARPLLLLALVVAAVPPAACQAPASAPHEDTTPQVAERSAGVEGAYRAGDAVEIEWQGGWYRGHVLEADANRFKVHYDGYGDSWDEWVGTERLRPVEAAAPASVAGTAGEERVSAGISATAGETATSGQPGASPPLGKYVCRQYMTTMGYLTLRPGGVYEVSGVTGRYRYDAGTGAMSWEGGSYAEWGWAGRYEHVSRPAGDGRPDEDIVRLTSEADGLRIACYRMADD